MCLYKAIRTVEIKIIGRFLDMVQRLLFCLITIVHLVCLGAGVDDIPMTLWQQADLSKAIEIVVLPDVLSGKLATQTKIVYNQSRRLLAVRTAVVVHAEKTYAEIFARHVVAADDYIHSPWRKHVCNEIYPEEKLNNEQKCRRLIDAIAPTELASITLMCTQDHVWPRYQIYTQRPKLLARYAETVHNEKPAEDSLFISSDGACNRCQLPYFKNLIAAGKSDQIEIAWFSFLYNSKLLGIRLNYNLIQDAYNELFPVSIAEHT